MLESDDRASLFERRYRRFAAAIEAALDQMPGAGGLEQAPAGSDDDRARRFAYRTGRFRSGKRIINELRAMGYDPEQKALLDIGCGFGGHVAAFSALDTYCVGTDFLDHDYARLRSSLNSDDERGAVSFVLADVNNLPFKCSAFDVVFENGLLEHLTDEQIRGFLRSVRHLLKDGGLAILGVPVALRGVRRDPHYGVPLVSLLPARAKRFVCESLLGRRYPWRIRQTSFLTPGRMRKWCAQEGLEASP